MPFVRDFVEDNDLNDTVSIMGRYPVEAMSSFFDKADVMLVTLKDDPIFNLTVPAKLQAYMSASKPVVAMLNGEGAENVIDADCGLTVAAGDYSALAKTILKASRLSSEELQKLGNNSRKYYEENFKMSACISNLESIISKKS